MDLAQGCLGLSNLPRGGGKDPRTVPWQAPGHRALIRPSELYRVPALAESPPPHPLAVDCVVFSPEEVVGGASKGRWCLPSGQEVQAGQRSPPGLAFPEGEGRGKLGWGGGLAPLHAPPTPLPRMPMWPP